MRRRILPVTAAVALIGAASLTACTSAAPAASCEAPFSPGALSNSVKVSGDSADTLRVSLDRGVGALNTQRTVVSESANRSQIVTPGSIVAANFAYVDSSTGDVLEVSPGFGTGSGGILTLASADANPIVAGTLCAAVGDTLALALSDEQSAAMGVNGALVVLVEIDGISSSRAEGTPRALPFGYPAVTNDDTGRPGVVLPPQQPLSGTNSALRIEGKGEKVTAEQTVIGQVLTVSWDGTEVKNTWATSPESFGTEADAAQSGVTFRAALTGYPVGSQVVVIENTDSAPRVSVVDILAVA